MLKYPNFIGIVERRTEGPPFYEYCILNIDSGNIATTKNIDTLATLVEAYFGADFLQKIAYKPPKEIYKTILNATGYYEMSIKEKDNLEKTVLKYFKRRRLIEDTESQS